MRVGSHVRLHSISARPIAGRGAAWTPGLRQLGHRGSRRGTLDPKLCVRIFRCVCPYRTLHAADEPAAGRKLVTDSPRQVRRASRFVDRTVKYVTRLYISLRPVGGRRRTMKLASELPETAPSAAPGNRANRNPAPPRPLSSSPEFVRTGRISPELSEDHQPSGRSAELRRVATRHRRWARRSSSSWIRAISIHLYKVDDGHFLFAERWICPPVLRQPPPRRTTSRAREASVAFRSRTSRCEVPA